MLQAPPFSFYSREASKSQSELQGEVNRIKSVGRLVSQVEDLQNRIVKEKNPTRKAELTQQEKDLRAKVKRLSNELGLGDAKRLDSTKKRTEEKTKELQERIKNKDFSKKTTRPVIADTELIRLRAEQQKVRDQYEKELHKAELDNRSTRIKMEDAAIEIWGLTRSLMATGEMSFILIQGGIQSIAHPKNAARALLKAVQHGWSEQKAERWGEFIKSQPWYETMKKSKLSLSEYDARLEAREEAFLGGWVNKIWDAAGYPLKITGDTAYEKWKKVNPIKAIERAGVGYMNTLRVLRFLDAMYVLEKDGKTLDENPQDFKNAADAINTLTGRASLGPLEDSRRMKKVLPLLFFSPRNWASQLKTITPLAFYHFGKMGYKDGKYKPSAAQKIAMADYMKFMTATVGAVLLAAAYVNNDDEEETEVNLDPRSTDFMKIRLGNTRIDGFAGRQQFAVLQSRLIMEALNMANLTDKNPYVSTSGKEYRLGQKFSGGGEIPTAAGLITKMAQNKLSPSMGILVSAAQSHWDEKDKRRENDFGEPFLVSDELAESVYPMYVGTVNELWAEQPEVVAGFLTAYAFLGGGVSTYGEKKKEKSR